MNVDTEQLKLKHPFTLICAGPTGSGKTILIAKILENYKLMTKPVPEKIIYCYSIWQDMFKNMLEVNPNIVFVQDMITEDQIDPSIRNLIILDDLMDESKDSGVLSKLFT